MRRTLWPGGALLAVLALAACGGGDGVSIEDALRLMVLQPGNLPESFIQADESLTTNDGLVSTAQDPEKTETLLKKWGRILGYEVTYEPDAAALNDSPVIGIKVAANLYGNEAGAGEAFADAVKTAAETDWGANYAGLRDFRQQEIDAGDAADEVVWLRLSGFQPAASGSDVFVTDDLIFFREGRERGFLRVQASSADSSDRGQYRDTVEVWLQSLVGNVRDALPQIEDGE